MPARCFREIQIGLTTVYEPYHEGIAWTSGFPWICTHESVKWAYDFYACHDHGDCLDCKAYMRRECVNEQRDGPGYQYEHAERMPVPADRMT